MLIKKRRIKSLEKNIRGVSRGEKIIVALANPKTYKDKVVNCGFTGALSLGEKLLPHSIGPVSDFNANGKYLSRKDKPMETAYRQGEWTWQEFHGRYSKVEKSKIVEIPYQRYPRTFITPPSVELSIATNVDENMFLISPEFTYEKMNDSVIIHVINLFLELFGECQILDAKLEQIIKAPIIRLNWKILPKGAMPWTKLRPKLEQTIARQGMGNQIVINKRFESINSHEPEFVAVGQAGFDGYLIFGFPKIRLFVLESTAVNNATYILNKNWEVLSTLTKAEILNEALHKERVIHRENWFHEINRILNNR
jgi:hypothetical protein